MTEKTPAKPLASTSQMGRLSDVLLDLSLPYNYEKPKTEPFIPFSHWRLQTGLRQYSYSEDGLIDGDDSAIVPVKLDPKLAQKNAAQDAKAEIAPANAAANALPAAMESTAPGPGEAMAMTGASTKQELAPGQSSNLPPQAQEPARSGEAPAAQGRTAPEAAAPALGGEASGAQESRDEASRDQAPGDQAISAQALANQEHVAQALGPHGLGGQAVAAQDPGAPALGPHELAAQEGTAQGLAAGENGAPAAGLGRQAAIAQQNNQQGPITNELLASERELWQKEHEEKLAALKREVNGQLAQSIAQQISQGLNQLEQNLSAQLAQALNGFFKNNLEHKAVRNFAHRAAELALEQSSPLIIEGNKELLTLLDELDLVERDKFIFRPSNSEELRLYYGGRVLATQLQALFNELNGKGT